MNFEHPIWSAGFRPFFLLGAIFAPILLYETFPGAEVGRFLWHGHEMLFGLAGGICTGFILTALPSWAGTKPVSPQRLALLAAIWLLGRAASAGAGLLPSPILALPDLALFPLLALFTLPDVARLSQKSYLALAPILLALFLGNCLFHLGMAQENWELARQGLYLGLAGNVGLFGLVWGFLTPTFTRTALEEMGRDARLGAPAWLEWSAHLSLLAFLATGLLAPRSPLAGYTALAAALIHFARLTTWKVWRVGDLPIVYLLHLAYLWLAASFAIRAGSDLLGWPPTLWVHAFTTGGLGAMMVAMLTRVSQRHTGRPFQTGPAYLLMALLVTAGALLRLKAGLADEPRQWLIAAAVLWGSAFLIFLARSGAYLIRPSLPKKPL
jgi:uncharacterized protein involved in response to NO